MFWFSSRWTLEQIFRFRQLFSGKVNLCCVSGKRARCLPDYDLEISSKYFSSSSRDRRVDGDGKLSDSIMITLFAKCQRDEISAVKSPAADGSKSGDGGRDGSEIDIFRIVFIIPEVLAQPTAPDHWSAHTKPFIPTSTLEGGRVNSFVLFYKINNKWFSTSGQSSYRFIEGSC